MAEQETPKEAQPVNPLVQAAKDRQAIEEANLAVLVARQKRIEAMMPSLNGVTGDTLAAAENGPQVGSVSAVSLALQDAAKQLAAKVDPQPGWKIFVTSEEDLASVDAAYRSVVLGLEQLSSLADHIANTVKPVEVPEVPVRSIDETEPSAEQAQYATQPFDMAQVELTRTLFAVGADSALGSVGAIGGTVAAGVGAFAALALGGPAAIPFGLAAATGVINALPAVISALSTKQTVSSKAADISSLTATLEVVSQLLAEDTTSQDPFIVHSHFRFNHRATPIDNGFETLAEQRRTLVMLSMAVAKTRSLIEERSAIATAIMSALEKELADAKGKAKSELLAYLLRVSQYSARLTNLLAETAVHEGLVTSALEAIDTFVSVAQAAPPTGGRSPREDAALMSLLFGESTAGAAAAHRSQSSSSESHRRGSERGSWRILLVKPLPGQAHTSTQDGGLFRKDGFLAIGEAALTWALLEVPDPRIQQAGTVIGKGHVFTSFDISK